MILQGKCALVTGASSGIGLEIARELARLKADLVLVSRSAGKLNSIADEISKEQGVSVKVIPIDLSKSGAAVDLHRKCLEQKLKIDILVNNAGVGLFGIANEQDLEQTLSMINLNVSSLVELSILFSRDMVKCGYGRIMNVGSMVGYMSVPFFAAYAATKSFVRSFSISHRAELKGTGVTVTSLEPGFVKTNFDKAANAVHGKYAALSAANGMGARQVARIGVKALLKKKSYVVAGFHNWVASRIIVFLPKPWLSNLIFSLISGLIGKK